MITIGRVARQPTKQKLIEEGVRLFAEKGFRETSVGEIEAAAGLQPRRGALYRHYPSKEALLKAALEQHLQNLGAFGSAMDQLEDGDVRDQALGLGRWLLNEVAREHAIMRILEQDGDRLPRLRKRFLKTLVDPGYVLISAAVHRWIGPAAEDEDIDALAAVLLGGLVNYHRSTWTFQVPPAGLDEERFLTSWANLCCLATEALSRQARTSR